MSNLQSYDGWPQPLCLIQNFQGQEMAVDPRTFDKLCQIEDKFVPVSVVGLYRTGKSYLLNQLAGKKSGLLAQIFIYVYFDTVQCAVTFLTTCRL